MTAPLGVVSWRAFVAIFDTFKAAGVPDASYGAPLLTRLAQLRESHEQVSWDIYLDMVEQAHASFGGDEAFLRACEGFDAAVPEVRAFASPTVRAQEFCKFVFQSFDVAAYPDVKINLEELPDGSIDLTVSIPESLRGSRVWFLANVGALKTMTRHLGLPPLEVDGEIGTHRGRYRMRFPDEAKARTGESTPTMAAVTDLVSTMRADIERVASVPPARIDRAGRLKQLAEKWDLTTRQEQVLGLVCQGMSNKQIASDLQVAARTVEIHVSDILRKAKLDSRAQLVASFAAPDRPRGNR